MLRSVLAGMWQWLIQKDQRDYRSIRSTLMGVKHKYLGIKEWIPFRLDYLVADVLRYILDFLKQTL